MMPSAAAENAIIGAAHKVLYTGAATALASGTAETTGTVSVLGTYGTEIAAVGAVLGVVFGGAGLAVQTYFSWRRDQREQKESTWRMGIDPDRRRPWRMGIDPDRRRPWRRGVDPDRRRPWRPGDPDRRGRDRWN